MRKTNLRINNFFILEDKKKFYLSDIDLLEEWNDLSKKDLTPYFKKEVTDFAQYLKSSDTASGYSEVFYPGEIEYHRSQININSGIMVENITWNNLKSLAMKLEVLDDYHFI